MVMSIFNLFQSLGVVVLLIRSIQGFSTTKVRSPRQSHSLVVFMTSNQPTTVVPSWSELKVQSEATTVGQAIASEVKLRSTGQGSAHVQNTLRTFRDKESTPAITLYRDHAGWCPYCQKTVSYPFCMFHIAVLN
jgi:hypothetical protein